MFAMNTFIVMGKERINNINEIVVITFSLLLNSKGKTCD